MGKTIKISVFLLLLFSGTLKAQIREIGFYVGFPGYFGDAFLYEPLSPWTSFKPTIFGAGVTYKHWLGPYTRLRADAGINMLSMQTYNQSEDHELPSFNTIAEVNALWEVNMIPNSPYRYENLTPYLVAGLSLFRYDQITQTNEKKNGKVQYAKYPRVNLGIPIGAGLKVKFMRDITFNIEYKVVYTFTDNLDWSEPINRTYYHPQRLEYGNGNTNDWYSLFSFGITYMFGVEGCHCEPAYQNLNK